MSSLLSFHAPDAALFFVREVLGAFFLISGFNKVFYPPLHQKISGFFNRLGVGWAVWPVTLGEMFGGAALVLGFLVPAAVIGLLIIMAGAIKLDTWAAIKAKQPRNFFDFISKAICTSESLLVVGLLAMWAIAASGVVPRLASSVTNIPGGVGEAMGSVLSLAPWIVCLIVTLAPILHVRAQRRRVIREVEADLPLILEILAALAEAGLGFDASLIRVLDSTPPDRPLHLLYRQGGESGIYRRADPANCSANFQPRGRRQAFHWHGSGR